MRHVSEARRNHSRVARYRVPPLDESDRLSVARAVVRGLTASVKRLPSWLLYDCEGSRLYERITALPEYYPTRTEEAIVRAHADDIVEASRRGSPEALTVIELGAGSATKTETILDAVLRRQATCCFVPIDVSATALFDSAERIGASHPAVDVCALPMRYEAAFPFIARLRGAKMALFLGSTVGNLDDADASTLLWALGDALGPRGALVLGTDLRKSPSELLPAYDDAEGVTAAFNMNLLARLNRELGADFDARRFRHVARWNDAASRVEMHLESLAPQRVHVATLDVDVTFAAGETIHTESSVKYTERRVDAILGNAGFARERTWLDEGRRFGVHLARVVA